MPRSNQPIQNPLLESVFLTDLTKLLQGKTVTIYEREKIIPYARPILHFIYKENTDFVQLLACVIDPSVVQILQDKLPIFLATHLLIKFQKLANKNKAPEEKHLGVARVILSQLYRINTAESCDIAEKLSKFTPSLSSISSYSLLTARDTSRGSSLSVSDNSGIRLKSTSPEISTINKPSLLSKAEEVVRPFSPATTAIAALPKDLLLESELQDFVTEIEKVIATVKTMPLKVQEEYLKIFLKFEHKSSAFYKFPGSREKYFMALLSLAGVSANQTTVYSKASLSLFKMMLNFPNEIARVCVTLIKNNPEFIDSLLPFITHFLVSDRATLQNKKSVLYVIATSWPQELIEQFGKYVAEDMYLEAYDKEVLRAICHTGLGLSNDLAHLCKQHNLFIKLHSRSSNAATKLFDVESLRCIWGNAIAILDPQAQEILACATFAHNTNDDDDTYLHTEDSLKTNLSDSEIATIIAYQVRLRSIAAATGFKPNAARGCFVPKNIDEISAAASSELALVLGDCSHHEPVRIAIRKVLDGKPRIHNEVQFTVRYIGANRSIIYGFAEDPKKLMVVDHDDIRPVLEMLLKPHGTCDGIMILQCKPTNIRPPVLFRSRSASTSADRNTRSGDEFSQCNVRHVVSSPQLGPTTGPGLA